ncbi:MAG: apolipoprotein acyltransferase [Sulfitobacter sp.]|nr:apolipoprotein acyltransferase [Sulfitobacter sp.]
MIYILFALVGAVAGAFRARKQGGNRKDMAQYAAGFAIAFGLLGLIVTIILDRIII